MNEQPNTRKESHCVCPSALPCRHSETLVGHGELRHHPAGHHLLPVLLCGCYSLHGMGTRRCPLRGLRSTHAPQIRLLVRVETFALDVCNQRSSTDKRSVPASSCAHTSRHVAHSLQDCLRRLRQQLSVDGPYCAALRFWIYQADEASDIKRLCAFHCHNALLFRNATLERTGHHPRSTPVLCLCVQS